MKTVITLLALLLAALHASATDTITISARKTVELTYAQFDKHDVVLDNKSGKQIDVAVINPTNKKTVKSFGLGPMGRVVLRVDPGQVLTLTNRAMKEISLGIDFIEREPEQASEPNSGSVSFTLHNPSLKSIPLIIPDVMNPNLSPISNSGVNLRIGQEIYYKKDGKKMLLLVVDDSIKPGAKIDVAQLIKDLEKE